MPITTQSNIPLLLSFALRSRSCYSLAETAAAVGSALGCSFTRGKEDDKYYSMYVTARLLNIEIDLYPTSSGLGEPLFVLVGSVDDSRYWTDGSGGVIKAVDLNISPVIMQILHVDDCGEWWIPSKEEIAAETDYFYQQQELETAEREKQRMLEAGEDPD